MKLKVTICKEVEVEVSDKFNKVSDFCECHPTQEEEDLRQECITTVEEKLGIKNASEATNLPYIVCIEDLNNRLIAEF